MRSIAAAGLRSAVLAISSASATFANGAIPLVPVMGRFSTSAPELPM
jgi:hypothetical protein